MFALGNLGGGSQGLTTSAKTHLAARLLAYLLVGPQSEGPAARRPATPRIANVANGNQPDQVAGGDHGGHLLSDAVLGRHFLGDLNELLLLNLCEFAELAKQLRFVDCKLRTGFVARHGQ